MPYKYGYNDSDNDNDNDSDSNYDSDNDNEILQMLLRDMISTKPKKFKTQLNNIYSIDKDTTSINTLTDYNKTSYYKLVYGVPMTNTQPTSTKPIQSTNTSTSTKPIQSTNTSTKNTSTNTSINTSTNTSINTSTKPIQSTNQFVSRMSSQNCSNHSSHMECQSTVNNYHILTVHTGVDVPLDNVMFLETPTDPTKLYILVFYAPYQVDRVILSVNQSYSNEKGVRIEVQDSLKLFRVSCLGCEHYTYFIIN